MPDCHEDETISREKYLDQVGGPFWVLTLGRFRSIKRSRDPFSVPVSFKHTYASDVIDK